VAIGHLDSKGAEFTWPNMSSDQAAYCYRASYNHKELRRSAKVDNLLPGGQLTFFVKAVIAVWPSETTSGSNLLQHQASGSQI
jgi:hypothetical protein